MATTTKPTFDSLTPEQVNDLIATKVMGWYKENDYDPHCYWLDSDNKRVALRECDYEYAPTEGSWDTGEDFDPYNSLDDCWKAEEKVGKTFASAAYCYQLAEILKPGINRQDNLYHIKKGERFVRIETSFPLLHATAKQKCEAMLRAIGEVV